MLVSLLLLATIATISVVAYIEVQESLLKNIDYTLRAMAEGITADLDEPESHEAHQVELRSITGSTNNPYSTRYRVWIDGSGEDLFASDSPVNVNGGLLVNTVIDNQPEIGESVFFNLNLAQHGFRAIWMRHRFEKDVINILVARSSYSAYHEMDEFLRLLLILGGSMVLGIFLLVPPIASLAMRPIGQTAKRMEQVTYKDLGQESMHNPKVPMELEPFVTALSKMLARLDKVMSQQRQFTADASHELRTPLALIKSTIQTTRMRDRDVTEYKQAMDDILKDIQRLEKLITELLSLARLNETDILADMSSVSLDALLHNLGEIFDSRASQKGGKVLYEEFPSVEVRGNEDELVQLFSNLLDNTIQHGPPNGTVSISLQEEPEGYVTVCIHDEGGHIPPEALPHLFERFYRVDSSRCKATGGTGLGLAIAKEIVCRHAGEIEITSSPAAGTSVLIRLPKL